jgi:hypothetical protein
MSGTADAAIRERAAHGVTPPDHSQLVSLAVEKWVDPIAMKLLASASGGEVQCVYTN